MNNPLIKQHSSRVDRTNVYNMDQTRIVRSIKEKCGLIDNLFTGSHKLISDIERDKFNENTIRELIISAQHMLNLITTESVYLEVAEEVEKVLLKMNYIHEAALLYDYNDDRFS